MSALRTRATRKRAAPASSVYLLKYLCLRVAPSIRRSVPRKLNK